MMGDDDIGVARIALTTVRTCRAQRSLLLQPDSCLSATCCNQQLYQLLLHMAAVR